jgi:hypothetical protein
MGETQSIFEKHPEYTFLHSGAHRKPPARIGAPGLCRQINFWIPPADPMATDGAVEPIDIRRSEWISRVDEFIAGIVAHVTDPTTDPGFSAAPGLGRLRDRSYNVYGERNARLYLFQHSVGRVNGRWELRPAFQQDGTPRPVAECRCPDHRILPFDKDIDFSKPNMPARYQNFSLAFFWHNVWVKFRFMRHSEYVSMGIYIDLSGSDRLDNPCRLRRGDTGEIDHTLWDRISGAFLMVNEVCGERYRDIRYGNMEEHRSARDRERLAGAHRELYETIWLDFEREILGPSLDLCSKDLRWKQVGAVVYDGRIVLLHMPPGYPASAAPSATFFSPPRFDCPQLSRLSERIALNDVLNASAALACADTVQPYISASSTTNDARIEYTANLLLGRRVVYMSSLSAEFTGSDRDFSPTKSLLVCKPNHSWQLGRLIDRLFLMGSARVAALINLEALIATGDKLQAMMTLLEKEDERVREWTPDDLHQMENLAVKVRTDTVKLNDGCEGGIDYRIERSRYYVGQFTEAEKTLRLDMIEGFQIYSTFVRRRYFSTYDHIHRLGDRLARHRLAFASLTQRIGYRNERMLQRRLLGLQVVAELFLSIPLVYYTGHILENLLKMLGLSGVDLDTWKHKTWLWAMTLIPFVIILRVQHHWEQQRKLETINSG